ncbi:amidohydrolase family protein [Sphingomonas sp. AP4-R1]|uniref:N-acyl-D-amino-acid deacylase family protein n=1 Tax=Sphingomonas sp. AP4-R1 TaxID=2735134 RepID=UPI001493CF94|nr:amidohydrolase family protein [Sphingomonas sp. AP4-R1]QJU57999.1 amidohydrolase family protein [Sphingomonas sp. AP4-R1]
MTTATTFAVRAAKAAAALGLLVSAATAALAADYDVLIRGGTLYDGTGSPAKKGDIAIKGDRIVAVGVVPASATADKVVDATGKYVTPGFIDPHSHAVPGIATAELAGAKSILTQGITTVFANPDGGGPGDLAPLIADIDKNVPGVNVIPMIGHNGVRSAVMGLANRQPTPVELQKMEGLVDNAMKLGAWGFSDGPFYIPAKYSKTDEIVDLAKVAAKYPGSFYISHIRDESSYDIGVIAAIQELITVSRQAHIEGIVTHMKMLGPEVWGKSAEAIRIINAARAEGLSIWADQYPYAASGSGLQPSLVPGWAQEGGPDAIAKRLANPEQAAVIRKEMVRNLARRAGANAIMIRSYAPDPSLEGKRLDEIARAKGQDPIDTAIDMLKKGGAGIVSFNMNEKDVEAIMKQPWTMTSTDGSLVTFGKGAEHPRAYGAFPRKLRLYTLDRHVITMEQSIHSMTGLPAHVFKIPFRGELKTGNFADVVVFDPKTVRDTATYNNPHSYSVGMDYVFVNGKPAIWADKVTPDHYGKVLLRQENPPSAATAQMMPPATSGRVE